MGKVVYQVFLPQWDIQYTNVFEDSTNTQRIHYPSSGLKTKILSCASPEWWGQSCFLTMICQRRQLKLQNDSCIIQMSLSVSLPFCLSIHIFSSHKIHIGLFFLVPWVRPGFEMHFSLSTQTAFTAFRVPPRPGFKSYWFFFSPSSLAFLTKEGYFVNYQLVQINKRYFHRKPHLILLKFDYKDGGKRKGSQKEKPQMAFFIHLSEWALSVPFETVAVEKHFCWLKKLDKNYWFAISHVTAIGNWMKRLFFFHGIACLDQNNGD